MLTNTDHNLLDVNLSAFNTIPGDVLPVIFGNLSLEMDVLALVCNTWKERVDSEMFREMIRPPRVIGIKQLINHNSNIIFEGKEHPLPRKFYREYAEKGGLCFFNPGRVKLKIANGKTKLVVLNSLEAIASLFPNTNFKARFTDDSWEQMLKEVRKEEAPHWVWEEAHVRGFNKTYAEQQKEAEEVDKALYPERYQAIEENTSVGCSESAPKSSELSQRFNISTGVLNGLKAIANLFKYQKASKPKQIVIMSNAEDHVLGKFMAEAILGERKVTWDPNSGKYELVRVKSTIKIGNNERPIVVGVAASGRDVDYAYDAAYYYVGFICARKSFAN